MKSLQFFSGHDSFGRQVHVSQGENQSWYYRMYGFNGFGKGWSKWEMLKDFIPTFKTKIVNVYDSSETEIEYGELLEWGFTSLHKIEDVKVRLPNN
jgi:hypothetical protein